MRRILVLANCASGQGTGEAARRRDVATAFEGTGFAPEVHCVPGTRLAHEAKVLMASNPDTLVAAGGDGTISAVAGVVAGTEVALGVLPMGTRNHFARDLRIPLDLAQAARVIAGGHRRNIDVAEVNGRVFVNNSSVGMYPSVVRRRDDRRQHLGETKRRAMLKACAEVLRRPPRLDVAIGVDGDTRRRTTPFVFVGNNPYNAGLALGRRSTLTSGRLGVYHTGRTDRLHVLGLAARAMLNRLDKAPGFEAQEALELVVATRAGALRVSIDGEVERMRLPLRYRIRPGALCVLVPGNQGAA